MNKTSIFITGGAGYVGMISPYASCKGLCSYSLWYSIFGDEFLPKDKNLK